METNYDPWLQPPKSDPRRDVAIKALEKIGQDEINPKELYKVSAESLVLLALNETATIAHVTLQYL